MTADVEIVHPAPGSFRRAGYAALRLANTTLAGWRLPALITLAAAAVRFVRLDHPPTIVPLDETYYAPNAFGYLCHGTDMGFKDRSVPPNCNALEPVFVVHPPAAKLLMAVGIRIFGYDAFGWRSASALFGSLSVLVIYLLARRLWDSRWLAAAAAVLLGVEGLQLVQSRLAMLDIFMSFFILLGVWLLLEDRARAPGRAGPRWWRLASGVAFGLAVSSKWSAAPLLPVAFAVGLAWEAVRLRPVRAPKPEMAPMEGEGEAESVPMRRRPRRDWLPYQAAALAITFGLLPVLVYIGTYTPWFLSTKRYIPPLCHITVSEELPAAAALPSGGRVVATPRPGIVSVERSVPKAGLDLWLCNQREIFNYHKNLKSTNAEGKPIHPYMSKAWSWPWISRPAAHYYTATCVPSGAAQPCPAGEIAQNEEILGLPNPLIWWVGFFIALPLCAWWMVVRRDDVAALLLVLFLPLVLPWFLTTRPLFMFYMTPAVPFLVLMLVHVMKVWRLRATAVAFVVLSVGAFVYFYPVLAAYPLPPQGIFGWESRILFGHVLKGDCVLNGATNEGIKLLCWI